MEQQLFQYSSSSTSTEGHILSVSYLLGERFSMTTIPSGVYENLPVKALMFLQNHDRYTWSIQQTLCIGESAQRLDVLTIAKRRPLQSSSTA